MGKKRKQRDEEEKRGRRYRHRAFLLRASPLKAVRYDFLSDAKTDKPKRENERERERRERTKNEKERSKKET